MTTSTRAGVVRVITDVNEVASVVTAQPDFASVEHELIQMIANSGALLGGFFHLLSGQHSEKFLRYSAIASLVENNRRIAELVASLILRSPLRFERILSPDTAGILLASELSRILGRPRLVARTDEWHRPDSILNGIDLKPGQTVLLVNDLITSGTGLMNLRTLVERHEALVVGRAVFALRSSAPSPRDLEPPNEPIFSVVRLNVETVTYAAPISRDVASCEVCRERPDAIYSGDIN